jgi:CubicO group peptidase (beta-lactamase class C family)
MIESFNLDKWQETPLNRWAFQHVDDFIPTNPIAPSERPYIWPVALKSELREMELEIGNSRAPLMKHLEDLYTDSFLVVRRGEIIVEEYLNGMSRDSRHLLQSVSKSILGILYGRLLDQKVIELDRPIGYYIPELVGSGFYDATIRNALDMTVAANFSEEYNDRQSEIQQEDRVAGWRLRQAGDPVGIREFLKTIKKHGEHGTQFQYCSANTDVLAWLATEAVGIEYGELLSREIWQPLKASSHASITVDAFGNPLANGGISTTTRDLALMGQMILNSGQIGDTPVVSSDWINETSDGASQDVVSVDYLQSLHPGGSYRNQWWITKGIHREIYGVGIYGLIRSVKLSLSSSRACRQQ